MNLFLRTAIILLISLPAMAQSQPDSAQGCVESASPKLCLLIERGEIPDSGRPYQKQIQQFYAAEHYNFAWLQAGKPTSQALAMIQALQGSENQGLRAEDYDGPRWSKRLALLAQSSPSSADDLARFDLSLTLSAMAYMSDLCCGRVDPRLNVHLVVDRQRCNLPQFLHSRVIHAADLATTLKEIEPPYAGYQRTKGALGHYLMLAKEGEGEPLLRPRKTIHPGDACAGISALEQRLRRLGDIAPETAASESTIYEGVLVEAVKHFQQRHGLNPDGRIDPATFRELTVPFAFRIKQLQLTLERYRWLPPDLPSRLIVVNIPEFMLRAYDNHHSTLTMRVIVGKAFREHQTPVFQDEMEYLIFRPYWNVPITIVRKEMIPDLKKKSGFLGRHQLELVNAQGKIVNSEAIGPATLQQLRAGQLDIRQKPGPANSLGLIKFVFPNHFDVYLHGTPEQQLFSRSRRDFSHGCIRVEDPTALAQWVLHDNPAWTRDRIESAMNGSKSFRVDLPTPLPVLILYGTALVEENGEVHFFEDIYGQDVRLEHALAQRRD